MEMTDKRIGAMPIFEGTGPGELYGMLACLGAFTRHYGKNEYISFEEEQIRYVGLVLEGAVHMLRQDVWGNESILVRSAPGDLIGESFACGSSAQALVSFRTEQPSDILFLAFDRVLHTCSSACVHHQHVIENMVTMIADKNQKLIVKLEILSCRSLREKVMAYLSVEAQKQGSRYVEIPMKRQQLADYLCTDRSALARELSSMRRDGIIDYDKNTFRLLVRPAEGAQEDQPAGALSNSVNRREDG